MTKALEAAVRKNWETGSPESRAKTFEDEEDWYKAALTRETADIIRAYAANVTEEMGDAAREERARLCKQAPPGSAISWSGENDRAIVRAAIERGLV